LALLAIGTVLIVFGISASESIGSEAKRFFTGTPTDKSMWLLVGRRRRDDFWRRDGLAQGISLTPVKPDRTVTNMTASTLVSLVRQQCDPAKIYRTPIQSGYWLWAC